MPTRLELQNQIEAIADDCPFTMPFWLAGMLLDECRRQGLSHVIYDDDDFKVTVKNKTTTTGADRCPHERIGKNT